ncbi:hypothetical protein CFB46_34620 [Burkholderia sp. HI2761]|uniref:hypothetical protein n=1 Tax=unclassified Burkholderia TaxID=2613784 RepID=UPI000B7AE135|nr:MULTISPECIES: hypothetical protein [unclassified Burkholderia]MPV61417.1 hypothetical protein [Burkholderia sp. BE24]OXJ21483.1 hypothetical protein CFB46_34620 [Burkholderia sp. HI2761]
MRCKIPDGSPESMRRVLLARMAATRAELSASNQVVELTRRTRFGDVTEYPTMKLPTLDGSTGAAIAVALAGFVILGPRRLVTTAIQAGLVALIGRMTRDIVQK